MKRLLLLLAIIGFYLPSKAQALAVSEANTVDATLTTLYGVISGEKGTVRNWDKFKALFLPEANLISCGKDKEGKFIKRVMTPDTYVENAGKRLVEIGFFEKEVAKKKEVYGNVTHVFSTYESRHSLADEKPFARGINSIQLYFDGERYYIVNIIWESESAANPIPEKYLK